MPRFYFHLNSDTHSIPDMEGKQLASLNAAQDHALKLIDKIITYVGNDDEENWLVKVTDNEFGTELIVPFSCATKQKLSA